MRGGRRGDAIGSPANEQPLNNKNWGTLVQWDAEVPFVAPASPEGFRRARTLLVSTVTHSIHLLSPQIEGEGGAGENASGGSSEFYSPKMETALSAFGGCASASLRDCAGVNEPEGGCGEARVAAGEMYASCPSSVARSRRSSAEINLGDVHRLLDSGRVEGRGGRGKSIRVAANEGGDEGSSPLSSLAP